MSAAVDTPAVTALNEAQRLTEHGYALTPVTITRSANGKKAARFHKGWRHESAWSRDPDQVRQWWVDHPDTSFAIGCAANGIEGVDLDVKPALGIDAVTEWSARGLPLSTLVQHTPSGGLHSIWRVRGDGLALPQEAGKTLGVGLDTRNRAGLFFAAGAYILGEEGHYTIAGTLPRLDQLEETPRAVVDLFADAGAQERAERPADGRIVIHDEHWQRQQVELALQAIRGHRREEGGYRKRLQHAGLFLGRAAEQGFLSAGDAEQRILEAHCSVWGPAVWPENRKDIRDALKDGPRLERWRVPVTPSSPSSGSRLQRAHTADEFFGGDEAAADAPGEEEVAQLDAFELEVLRKIRDLDVLELAKRRKAERDAAERPSILDGLIDANDLDDLPDPKMLLGEFIPEAGVGVIAGKFGAYKSFVTVSWACSLASGRDWLDKREFSVPEPVKVLYVAAEGASGMKLRKRAWSSRFGEIPRGNLEFYPRAINLTDSGAVTDLEKAIAVKGFKVVIVDTLHRSAPGAEENSSTELGLVFEAACRLRDDHAVTVLFVDHTGHGGERPRGSSIKVDDSDFVIIADRPGEAATSDIQRTLRMHKRKDMDTDGEWPIRLSLVEGTGSGYVEIGAVQASVDSPFGVTEEWHSLASSEVPEEVAEKIKGKGRAAALDIFRLLRFVGGERGMTQGEIQGTLSEGPRTHHRSNVHAALGLLSTAGLVVPGSTNERFLIAQQHVE